jgi:hypothetical protein
VNTRPTGSWLQTGLEEVGRICTDKSASVYEHLRLTCDEDRHFGLVTPKPVTPLPIQVVNDKGRYRQHRAPL